MNHYKVKSKEDWTNRVNRGAVAGDKNRDKLSDFDLYDYNEVEETEILKFLPALKSNMGLVV